VKTEQFVCNLQYLRVLANIVRKIDVQTTRYTYHVVRELLIWIHYQESITANVCSHV